VLALTTLTLAAPPNKRAVAFVNPTQAGGSMLDDGGIIYWI
jgi:phage terminase large subunit GpA-like protein